MSKTRLLLGTSDDPHVRPLADLIAKLDAANISCEKVRLDAGVSDAVNVSTMREQHDADAQAIIGGFSLGARIGALLSQEIATTGFIGLSFPFHRHGRPTARHGLAALALVSVPTLIIQGTRDSHGNREQIRGWGNLPACVRVHWLEDANHRWHSRGPNDGQHIQDAAETICSFIQHLVSNADV